MPENKKQGIFFTVIMCFLMVTGMSIYNLSLHNDLTMGNFFVGLVPGFIVAFFLDVVVVGPIAKKVAFNLPFVNKNKKIQLILSISTCMVLGMVSFMSIFGLVLEAGLSSLNIHSYLKAWIMNFIMALPLQLVVVGPISRTLLTGLKKQGIL
ncbi:DUF2798 domain-containing protein [Streptococcaceae bacterium ESL0729]|nr:DUF2798 domain-containing protein [Streptococcaceae bacterium ESL0729]